MKNSAAGQKEKNKARKHGISKAFRQYAKRYGGLDVDEILQIHRKTKIAGLHHRFTTKARHD